MTTPDMVGFFVLNQSRFLPNVYKMVQHSQEYIKTDNGGEFNKYQFNLFCENSRIIKLKSLEYNPRKQ